MKFLILGSEGYIGTALSQHLTEKGYEVAGIDNSLREYNVSRVGSQSVTEKENRGSIELDISKDFFGLCNVMREEKPDVIVHLAEQPSAPFSMRSQSDSDTTLSNNIRGTMNVLWAMKAVAPDAHLIKLGTEGEYPDFIWNGKHIPEGHSMEVGFIDPKEEDLIKSFHTWEIPTPRSFGSIYHSTKFYESHLIGYFCRVWGLTATDCNQGVVYGYRNGTRLDVDECFGTVVHRFVAQAVIGIPLTIHGTGGQTRGFINLQNSIEAITLLAENPPEKGEFRVIHQTTQEYSVQEIADLVQTYTGCDVENIENPRVEMAENQFTFDTSTLDDLGLKEVPLTEELPRLINIMKKNKDRIIKETIKPTVTWS